MSLPPVFCYPVLEWRVIDGDTIETNIDVGFKFGARDWALRLEGVDCPEHRPHRSKYEDGRGADEVQQLVANERRVADLVTRAVEEWCRTAGDMVVQSIRLDTFKGRYDGFLWGENWKEQTLNEWLLKNGLAVPFENKRKPWTLDQLNTIGAKALQREAIMSGW